MPTIKRFVAFTVSQNSPGNGLDELRKRIFAQEDISIECIAFTSVAPFEHTERVAYQTGYTEDRHICHLQNIQVRQNLDGLEMLLFNGRCFCRHI